MEEKIEKPSKRKSKTMKNQKCENYYYFLFIFVILIELFLILTSSQKYKEQKQLFKDKHNIIVNTKNNISNLLKEKEKYEKEINEIQTKTIINNNNTLKYYQSENINLQTKNNNLSVIFHKTFEEYESKLQLFNDEIIEKNDTIKELHN